MLHDEKNEFEIITGAGNILLVAPYGYPGDGDSTVQLTRLLAKKLNCSAVINEAYRRTNWIEINGTKIKEPADLDCNTVDLNRIPEIETAGLEKKWLGTIEEFRGKILNNHDTCLALVIHGAEDNEVKAVGNHQQADILLGAGKTAADSGLAARPTASDETVEAFTRLLKQLEPTKAVVAEATSKHLDISGNKCAGWDNGNLIQFLTKGLNGEQDPTVQSIQLTVTPNGFRKAEQVESTAEQLALAIKQLPGAVTVEAHASDAGGKTALASSQVEVVDDDKITRAAGEIIEIVQNSLAGGLIEVGNMLLRRFFNDDFLAARDRKKGKDNTSILQIHSELKLKGVSSISQSWLYNAIKVAADSKYIESRQGFFDLQTYVNLSASHKVLLESVKNDEQKRDLISEAGRNNCSFVELKNKIVELKTLTAPEPGKTKKGSILQVAGNPSKLFSPDYTSDLKSNRLKALRPSTREKLKNKVASKIPALNSNIQTLEKKLKKEREHLKKYQELTSKLDKMA